MVRIRVPATSANIGPGFDTLGLALGLYTRISFTELDCSELIITGCDEPYRTADNYAYVAYKKTMEYMRLPVRGLKMEIQSDIPVARGLGSSAAMYAAGAMGANVLHGGMLASNELLSITNALEGHPDNLAPAILGGFTTAMVHDGTPYACSVPFDRSLKLCAFIPDFETSTHEARRVLPKTVAYADAVFNVSHVAVLLGALRDGNDALIRASLCDRLHEPYRKTMIDGFDTVKEFALEAGCIAFFISGSGSTCMSIYRENEYVEKMRASLSALEHSWRVMPLETDFFGACED